MHQAPGYVLALPKNETGIKITGFFFHFFHAYRCMDVGFLHLHMQIDGLRYVIRYMQCKREKMPPVANTLFIRRNFFMQKFF